MYYITLHKITIKSGRNIYSTSYFIFFQYFEWEEIVSMKFYLRPSSNALARLCEQGLRLRARVLNPLSAEPGAKLLPRHLGVSLCDHFTNRKAPESKNVFTSTN